MNIHLTRPFRIGVLVWHLSTAFIIAAAASVSIASTVFRFRALPVARQHPQAAGLLYLSPRIQTAVAGGSATALIAMDPVGAPVDTVTVALGITAGSAIEAISPLPTCTQLIASSLSANGASFSCRLSVGGMQYSSVPLASITYRAAPTGTTRIDILPKKSSLLSAGVNTLRSSGSSFTVAAPK